MFVQINNVNVRYRENQVDSVQVHFSAYDEPRTISVTGYIPLTAEEYEGNEAIQALEAIVRQQISQKILEGPNAE